MITTSPDHRVRPAKDAQTTVAFVGEIGSQDSWQALSASIACHMGPDLIVSSGSNNYLTSGSGKTLPDQYAHSLAVYQEMIDAGKMIAAVGKADMDQDDGSAMVAHFNQSGRYFEYVIGDISFFVLNSGARTDGTLIEPDGNTVTSDQFLWFSEAASKSRSYWKVVVLNQAAHGSGNNQSNLAAMDWPFEDYGIDLVLSGNHRNYERLLVNGVPRVICYSSAIAPVDGFSDPHESGSLVRLSEYGAVRLDFFDKNLRVRFYDSTNFQRDNLLITKAYL